jgi:hypothetical protein
LRCEAASFTGILSPNATIETVAAVPEGGSYGEGSSNIPYPVIPTNLPALCAVTVRVRSSPSSGYRFGLFLPNEWDSRLLVVGNGGFAGGIAWSEMYVHLSSLTSIRFLTCRTGHPGPILAWPPFQPIQGIVRAPQTRPGR